MSTINRVKDGSHKLDTSRPRLYNPYIEEYYIHTELRNKDCCPLRRRRWVSFDFTNDDVKAHLNDILERFQKDERYRNDERYLKLWMRYVSF